MSGVPRLLGLLGLLSLAQLAATPALAYDVEPLQTAGDSDNRVDLVILGDGYRVQDQAKLTSDAEAFLARFWQQTPYGEYRYFFNVKLVHVISNENGADNGSYGTSRDTALGAYYNCYNIDRLICVDDSAVYAAANADAPEWDFIFVIVNDPKYGGSGGIISVFSVNEYAGEIAVHEFGHSCGGLADEYEDPYPGYPQCGSDCPEPNVTTQTVRELIKWNPWIAAATPVPTPETGTYWDSVGLFEGARYMTSGVFRPKQECCMRQLGVPFCEVCQEALVLAIYRRVTPLDSALPASPVSVGTCDTTTFSVSYPQPVPDTIEVTWRVDGAVAQTGGASFDLDASTLASGSHQVEAEIEDLTTLVRNDPSQLLVERRLWTVQVLGTPVCRIDGDCVPDGATNPLNPCEACDAAGQPGGWTALTGVDCDDGLFCNGTRTCQAGTCQPGPPPCSDDGLACTITCDEASATCNALLPGTCLISGACAVEGQAEPGNPCRTCQPQVDPGGFTPASGTSCSDGSFCNGEEICQAGACLGGTAPCSDDGLACTVTCDEAQDRCNAPAPGSCLIDGACVAAGQPEPGNPCRTCQPLVDPWGYAPADGVGCGDNLFCNGQEVCQGGTCQPAASPCADDGLACTSTCDEGADRCNVVQPGTCAIDGRCAAAGDADPANPCRSCQPLVDPAAWTPVEAGICDDGDPCTTGDACLFGACVPSGVLCNAVCPCEGSGCGCGSGTTGSPIAWLLALAALGLVRRGRG